MGRGFPLRRVAARGGEATGCTEMSRARVQFIQAPRRAAPAWSTYGADAWLLFPHPPTRGPKGIMQVRWDRAVGRFMVFASSACPGSERRCPTPAETVADVWPVTRRGVRLAGQWSWCCLFRWGVVFLSSFLLALLCHFLFDCFRAMAFRRGFCRAGLVRCDPFSPKCFGARCCEPNAVRGQQQQSPGSPFFLFFLFFPQQQQARRRGGGVAARAGTGQTSAAGQGSVPSRWASRNLGRHFAGGASTST